MVVSMRPMTPSQASEAYAITSRYPAVRGAPLCSTPEDPDTLITDPAELGIEDLGRPDFGDAVPVYPGEVPVFWACGVTSQTAALGALNAPGAPGAGVAKAGGPPAGSLQMFISHAPGHMFISDRRNTESAGLHHTVPSSLPQ